VVLALLLMWPLRHTGLALASSLSSYVNLLGLCWLLRRRLGGPRGPDLWRSLARTLGASALLALWCAGMSGLVPGVPAPTHRGLAWTVMALVGGMAVYAAGAAVLGSSEIRGLLGMLRRRPRTLPPAGGR